MNKLLMSASFVVAVLTLSACGSTRTMITQPAEGRLSEYESLEFPPLRNNVGAPQKLLDHIHEQVSRDLTRAGLPVTARSKRTRNTAAIRIAVIEWDEGSRAGRWLVGIGEGKATVQVKLVDKADGRLIGDARIEGTVTAGVAGGSMENAANRLITGIVKFVKSNY